MIFPRTWEDDGRRDPTVVWERYGRGLRAFIARLAREDEHAERFRNEPDEPDTMNESVLEDALRDR